MLGLPTLDVCIIISIDVNSQALGATNRENFAMPRSTAGDRVRRLLEEHWNANQSEMARETKCAQSTLSLVASGKKEPGKRLLTLIAAHAEVNTEWLFHGKGKPLTAGKPSSHAAACSLPIAASPLNGAPDENLQALSDERQDVIPQLVNSGSYILLVQGDDPITHDIEMGIHPGDRLLVDTTPASIPKTKRLFRALCVVRHPKNRNKVCLGLVTYSEADIDSGPERIEVDTFDLGLRPDEIIREKKIVEYRGRKRETVQLYKRIGDPNDQRLMPVSDLELEPPLHRIAYEDIVGLCKMMIRKEF